MKAKLILTTLSGIAVSLAAFSQNEIDDIYFNSKDRAKINSMKVSTDLGLAQRDGHATPNQVPAQLNPTDRYSARNINPEYSSQLNSSSNKDFVEDDVAYFNSNYQPIGVNQALSNCHCEGGTYYNPYYGQNSFNYPYYGNIPSFESPYGGYYPSAWGNPYNSFRPGLSISMGYGWGGINPSFYNGFNNLWNPYGSRPLWGNSYYPNQVIIINGDAAGRPIVRGKRTSRSTSTNNVVSRTRTSAGLAGVGRTTHRNGRFGSSQPDYYEQKWKRNQDINPSRGYRDTNSNVQPKTHTRSDYNWGNSNSGRQRSSTFKSPSRNSFNSGGSYSRHSRGSGTRGRNN